MIASTRELPAWAISLGMHLALLAVLATLSVSLPGGDILVTTVIDELDEEAYKFDATVVDQIGSDSDINKLSPSSVAAQHAGDDPQKQMQERLDEELLTPAVPQIDRLPQPSEAEILAEIETPGDHTQYTGGTEGALDRLTWEIVGSLRENKTLVIWLFDASQSVNQRRNEIADRFANVYKQLGQLEVGRDKALKTAVASFAERPNIITPEPVDDITEVVEAVRNIPPAKTGRENVFTAVDFVTDKWLNYRTRKRRNVMVIIVTDERGDDYIIEGPRGRRVSKLEQVIGKLRRYGIRAYCVGNACIFGREDTYVLWKYDDGVTKEFAVDGGPETVMAERLKLPFWGGDRNNRRYERLSAGYGPYALTRLCAETGGVFFVAQENNFSFDHAVMREHRPDYGPIRDYLGELSRNKAMAAVVAAAEYTRDKSPEFRPLQLRFAANNDNALRGQLAEAQKPAAVFDHALDDLLRGDSQRVGLLQGEKDRAKITEPRWRANYDLAMGRVLAMKARALGYNVVLARMMSEPKSFQKKGSNAWELVPSHEIAGGPTIKKLAEKARKYLARVIDQHPGTPWQVLAERELGQPMGWQWKETTMSVGNVQSGPGNNDGDEARLLLAREEERRRQMQKPKTKKRQPPAL